MDAVREGWFSEVGALWPGQALSLQVEEVLHRERTKFQDLAVLRTKAMGRVMVLDGCIQVTDRDEMSYHEMLAHVAVYSHVGEVRDVLIVGGGDGGVARELLKHKSITSITICDIDQRVTEVSEQYFPQIASGVRDPRVKLVCDDGAKYVAEHPGAYDIVVTDSSDPVGPAEVLYQKAYYKNLKLALRPGGIVCSQAESMWLHQDIIEALFAMCKDPEVGFPVVQYAYTSIPTYPSGTIGFLFCSLGGKCDKPVKPMTEEMRKQLRYYTPELHAASFCLPALLGDRLAKYN
eukprot:TRINITY_DN8044_c0_g1_i1.p1 TRINITY_DN8044_c0_g1~~TRINITY_DN8044_c0_g1_i1.p1  ORF type:complete len:305 (-),score=88.43 TRINITY_DN8044_c0_g1_i1:64-936(-)